MTTMTLTEQESEVIETLRSLSEHEQVEFSASREDGVWELRLAMTPSPMYHDYKNTRRSMFVSRGVGTSFIEAFNNMALNNDEPIEDGWGV
jgi:hypothetical protein